MPKHPSEPYLFAVKVDGVPYLVVRAMSLPESRDHFLGEHITIDKLGVAEAFRLGRAGVCHIENAKPEYAPADDDGAGEQYFTLQQDQLDADVGTPSILPEVPHG